MFRIRIFKRPGFTRTALSSLETLESRTLLSAGTLRIASYNIDADTSSFTNQSVPLETVLQGIGDHQLSDNGSSNSQPIDILALQELYNSYGTAGAPTLASITANLNAYYGSGTYAFDTTYDPTTGGTGGGPNGLIYNTQTVQIVSAQAIGTVSGSAEARAPLKFLIQPVGYDSSDQFYLFDSHAKSATGSSNANRRNIEAQTIIANVPAGAHAIALGDFNITSGSSEATYTTFVGTPGTQATFDDVALPSKTWNDTTVAGAKAISNLLSESATSVRYRDDIQFVTPAADPAGSSTPGLQYDSGSFQVFGNGGAQSLEGNSVNNSAANPGALSDLPTGTPSNPYNERAAVLQALTQDTDHLPVVADYSIVTPPAPTIGSFTVDPSSVASGGAITLNARNVVANTGTVASVNFYRESNNMSGLQIGSDAFVGAGSLSGTTWSVSTSTSGLAAGNYSYYAVATDTSNDASVPAVAALTVTGSPTIGMFTVNPTPVTSGNTVTLTASSVSDVGSSVTSVGFYLESNGVTGLQSGAGGDTLLGTGTQSGSTWTLSNASTTGLTAGTYTLYAVASDASGISSAAVSTGLTVFPIWLAQSSVATWNSSTHVLSVTGAATIIADPAVDEPMVVADGSAAQLAINPATSDVDVHVGGVTLTNGAGIDVVSVANRSHNNHNIVVIGSGAAAPTFSVDSASSLNLEDNDLIVHNGSLSAVQALAAAGRDGGNWDGPGLTSTIVMNRDASEGETIQLGVVMNSDLPDTLSQWTVGAASEALGTDDIIVKFTYTGDFNLDGKVDRTDSGIIGNNYDNGASSGNEWAFGDTNGDGKINRVDASIFGNVYGNGTSSGREATQL